MKAQNLIPDLTKRLKNLKINTFFVEVMMALSIVFYTSIEFYAGIVIVLPILYLKLTVDRFNLPGAKWLRKYYYRSLFRRAYRRVVENAPPEIRYPLLIQIELMWEDDFVRLGTIKFFEHLEEGLHPKPKTEVDLLMEEAESEEFIKIAHEAEIAEMRRESKKYLREFFIHKASNKKREVYIDETFGEMKIITTHQRDFVTNINKAEEQNELEETTGSESIYLAGNDEGGTDNIERRDDSSGSDADSSERED